MLCAFQNQLHQLPLLQETGAMICQLHRPLVIPNALLLMFLSTKKTPRLIAIHRISPYPHEMVEYITRNS
jgi:hypothetical protein